MEFNGINYSGEDIKKITTKLLGTSQEEGREDLDTLIRIGADSKKKGIEEISTQAYGGARKVFKQYRERIFQIIKSPEYKLERMLIAYIVAEETIENYSTLEEMERAIEASIKSTESSIGMENTSDPVFTIPQTSQSHPCF